MRMLLKVKMPIEPFNTYVRDGSAGQKISQILETIRPEAVYFTAQDGHRGGIFVVDMKDASQMPFYAEPFFLVFKAQVEILPTMTAEDLVNAGIEDLGDKWG